ncbi:MAG TPA: PTS sugar transporter subunit IIC [Anaeromyxobacteraceae bacterium]|nr:PTS sugar transporter subunit IIC [Anaeromyxobacteraceae bacterium]
MEYLLLAVVAGLAAVERKGFLQAMLSRPVALAPLTGLVLGDLRAGLLLGPPLELLWLGAVNLGAALPPHEALGSAAIVGGAVLAGRSLGTGVTPAVACLTVALVATLAVLGRRTDRTIEEQNVRLAARAESLLERGEFRAALRVNLAGLLLPFAASFVLAPIAAAAAAWLVPSALRRLPALAPPLALGWAALCGFAAAAGARAFRAQNGGQLFVTAVALSALLARMLGIWR